MPPHLYKKPEVIDWDALQNIRALTANGPAKDWQTRPQRYQEFIQSDEFRSILASMSLELHRYRLEAGVDCPDWGKKKADDG